jgi:hypothetical protein
MIFITFISNALFLTKVCLRVYNWQSQQHPFYRSRKGDSYGTEVVPRSSVIVFFGGNLFIDGMELHLASF